jgi:hypothetical protein
LILFETEERWKRDQVATIQDSREMERRRSCYYLRQKRDEREKELILLETRERLKRNRSEMEERWR